VTRIDGIAKGVAGAASETVFDELAARLAPVVPFDASIFFATDPAPRPTGYRTEAPATATT
jgi:hypothetical protein